MAAYWRSGHWHSLRKPAKIEAMGIDLKALASNFREHQGEMLSTANLRFDRDLRLFALFSQQASPSVVSPLPEGLKVGHYEDAGLRFDEKDRYGQPLTYTTSARIRSLPTVAEISDWNRAVLAFLLALPIDRRIVLYWC